MIWMLEGDPYLVKLVPHNTFLIMADFERTPGFLTLDKQPLREEVFLGKNILVLRNLSDKAQIVNIRADGSMEVLLEHDNKDPINKYELKNPMRFPVQPMLVPLDKYNQPIDEQLTEAFQMGEVITSGYLHNGIALIDDPHALFNHEYHLVDEPGKAVGANPLQWVFSEGYYIATKLMGIATAGNLWKMMYAGEEKSK